MYSEEIYSDSFFRFKVREKREDEEEDEGQ
jgi:hypothetical protein